MYVYELINPSDAYTFEAESDLVAALAALIVSSHYGAKRDGFQSGPYLFCDASDVERDLQERAGLVGSIPDAIDAHDIAIADCLDSFMIGGETSRETYRLGLDLIDDPTKKQRWKDEWHDKRRTSMSDIGARAWKVAAKLRANAERKTANATG